MSDMTAPGDYWMLEMPFSERFPTQHPGYSQLQHSSSWGSHEDQHQLQTGIDPGSGSGALNAGFGASVVQRADGFPQSPQRRDSGTPYPLRYPVGGGQSGRSRMDNRMAHPQDQQQQQTPWASTRHDAPQQYGGPREL